MGRGKERGRERRDFGEDHMTLRGYDGDRKWLQSMGGGGGERDYQLNPNEMGIIRMLKSLMGNLVNFV